MTKEVRTANDDQSLYVVCKIMHENNIGSVVITRRRKESESVDEAKAAVDEVGIITERDIIERVILQEKNPKEIKVREIMSTNIITVHALAPIEKAAQIMKESNIKKVPVILNNEIVGIITETDLSRTIHEFSESVEELEYFYLESRESIEQILADWEDLIIKIRSYKKLAMQKVNEENILKNNEENILKKNEENFVKETQ